MFRARFKREIVAEFLPPARANKKQKVIILCDGMPSVPRKQPLKVMIFHAKDDPYIPWRSVNRFAKRTGSKMKMLARGGHLKTECTVQKYWPQIKRFFES